MLFEFGSYAALRIREERVSLGLRSPLRILYASDLHLGHRWTRRVPERILDVARTVRPDLLLLGGDLIDSTTAIPSLSQLISSLVDVSPVYAIPGNHDEKLGSNRVRDAVRMGGGLWLPDESVQDPVRIDWAVSAQASSQGILCAHDPSIFPAAVKAGYGLVFAGHLHGGQCVFANHNGKQYPAVWFNRWHGVRFIERGARMLVSRGVADTFPFRVNCPREVIVCDIT